MKNNIKISTLSIVCVLCATALSASAAPSVRSLGGADTYSSASNAAASAQSGSAINAVRAGSARLTPSTGGSAVKSTAKGNSSSGGSARAASNPYSSRLSIGKYLNSGKTISGGSSIKNQSPGSSNGVSGGSGSSGSTDLQKQIDAMQKTLDALQTADEDRYTIGEADTLLENKQDLLIPGDGIEIKDGVITAVTVDGKQVLLQSDGNSIQWKYADDKNWQDLVALDDLTGPTGPQGEPGLNADLSGYPDNAAMSAAILNAIDTAALKYATAAQGLLAESALQEADMSNYAKTAEVNTSLEKKADISALGTLAAKSSVGETDITDASVTKAKLSTDVQASLDKAEDALTNADMSNYAKTAEVNTALADKADKTTTYSKTDVDTALTAKANTLDLGTLAAKSSVGETDITDASVTKAKLSTDVQASLGLADTSLQAGDVPSISGAPKDGADYVMVVNDGVETWLKVAYPDNK